MPTIDSQRCLACGRCMAVCPTGTLVVGEAGYRVLVGGKLGRHPQLAVPLPGIFAADQVVDIVRASIALHKERSQGGQRFGELLNSDDLAHLCARTDNSRQ